MSTTARRAAPRARRVSGGRRAAAAPSLRLQGIRWDRVARLSLLVALLLVLLSYIGPATKYWEAWHLNRETRAEVQTLREDNAALRERAAELDRTRSGSSWRLAPRHGPPGRAGVRRAGPAAGP